MRISRPDGNILKLVHIASNGEKYLAGQSWCFQKFVTDTVFAVQGCYVRNLDSDGEVALLADHTVLLWSGDVEE